MTLKYESEILFDLMKRDGDDAPSDVLPYESELKEKYLEQVEGAYPKLQDYRSEWLNYNLNAHLPADFPVETLSNVTEATVDNVVPYAFRSAILKGNTERINEHGFYQSDNSIFHLGYFEQGTYGGNIGGANKKIDDATRIRSINSYKVPQGTYSVELNSGFEGVIRGIDDYNTVLFNTEWSSSPTTTVTNDTTLLSVILRKKNQASISVNDLEEAYISSSGFDFANITLTNVKMPVLTTTGKNLFDVNKRVEGHIPSKSTSENLSTDIKNSWTTHWIKVEPNTPYTVSGGDRNRWQEKSISGTITYRGGNTITTSSDTEYIRCYYCSGDYNSTNPQIEKGSVATTYEPYKSNILTVNEEVELRGIGEIQDELNLLTGELTQRIGEVVLDGSESWSNGVATFGDFNRFTTNNLQSLRQSYGICDKIPYKATNDEDEHIYVSNSGMVYLFLSNTKASTASELKTYLSSNVITLQYPILNESIKTVDLTVTDQDGNTESIIRPIEGTMHVSTSSQTLTPLLDMSVPVEATTQNLMSFANIVEEEK